MTDAPPEGVEEFEATPVWDIYQECPPQAREQAQIHFNRQRGRDFGERMFRAWRAKQNAESTWDPVPIDDVLDGTFVPEEATLLPRMDGQGLLYRGRTHSIHGESESGKSLIMQAEAARILNDGGRVLFLDFESDRVSVVNRLRMFGVDTGKAKAGFTYVRPEEPPAPGAWDRLIEQDWDLAIVDGVTNAMNVLGFSGDGDLNDQAVRFISTILEPLARAGAAVVVIDHVTKSNDSRGRFAIGAQAKLSGLTGAAYTLEIGTPPIAGQVGELVLRIGKDRPAGVRQHCSPKYRSGDRTQEAARIVIDSTKPLVRMIVKPPIDIDPAAGDFRPTVLMHRVSDFLKAQDGKAVSANFVGSNVTGKRAGVLSALECLVEDGFVSKTPGTRGPQYALVASYVEGTQFGVVDEEAILDDDDL